jgi:hypothetical protein
MPDAGVPGTMKAMSTSLVYPLLRQVLQMLTRLARDDAARDGEILVLRILVLRHSVAVLSRQARRPDLEPADRVVLRCCRGCCPALAGRYSS